MLFCFYQTTQGKFVVKVYHVVPHNFVGDTLYPLNTLRDALPQIYAQQIKKFRGQDALTNRTIPTLNCQWNDTLHLSPVHPAQIREAIKTVGFLWSSRKWFEIDPQHKGIDATNTVIYTYPASLHQASVVRDEDFIPFSLEMLEMLNSIPQATHEYFNHAKAHDERPFLFNFIPHVLHYGTISVHDVSIINC